MKLKRFIQLFLILIFVSGFATLNWYCSSDKKAVITENTYAGLSDSAKYVGITTCKGCHSNVHSTFMHTGMGQSFDVASKEKSSADFEHHPKVYDRFRDLFYVPFWDKDSLKFMEYRIDHGDTVHKRIEKISYIVGSGQHTNSHMWVSNGYFYQAPLTFYTQKKEWDLPPGFENGRNSRFNRVIGLECMTCHNGYPQMDAGSENKFTLVKNGIDCERCHGPGSIHVKEKSMGIYVDTSKAIDYSIVNPAKLPMDLQFDVCQRCHIQGNAVVREGKSFFDFKPGMKLSDVMNVFMPVYEGRGEEHIMASHAERLKMSKCFKSTMAKLKKDSLNSKNSMKPYQNALTCVTCHNPHISVKATNMSVFNTVCSNCHSENKNTGCKEKKETLAKAENNCVSCHMPFNGAIDIPHVSVHDHKISIPTIVKDTSAVKKFIGINCINNPFPPDEAKAEAYINYYEKFGLDEIMLDSALKYTSSVNSDEVKKNFKRLIHIYYLKNDFKKVITILNSVNVPETLFTITQNDNSNAWTCYRIAESFQQLNENINAVKWFGKAYKMAPLFPDFANKFGSALAASGNLTEAKVVFENLVHEHPEFAPGFSNLGYLLLTTSNDQLAAAAMYQHAIDLDPDYVSALLNKAGLSILQNNKSQAIKILNRVLKIDPDNQQAQIALNRLK